MDLFKLLIVSFMSFDNFYVKMVKKKKGRFKSGGMTMMFITGYGC